MNVKDLTEMCQKRTDDAPIFMNFDGADLNINKYINKIEEYFEAEAEVVQCLQYAEPQGKYDEMGTLALFLSKYDENNDMRAAAVTIGFDTKGNLATIKGRNINGPVSFTESAIEIFKTSDCLIVSIPREIGEREYLPPKKLQDPLKKPEKSLRKSLEEEMERAARVIQQNQDEQLNKTNTEHYYDGPEIN